MILKVIGSWKSRKRTKRMRTGIGKERKQRKKGAKERKLRI